MPYARVTFVAQSGTGPYNVPFPYLEAEHVHVFVDRVEVPFTWVTESSLQLDTAVSNQEVIVRRITALDARVVDFENAAQLTEKELDDSADQVFFVAQEAADRMDDIISFGIDGAVDAGGGTIENVDGGSDTGQVVVYEQLIEHDATIQAYLAQTEAARDAASASEIAAAASAAQAIIDVDAAITDLLASDNDWTGTNTFHTNTLIKKAGHAFMAIESEDAGGNVGVEFKETGTVRWQWYFDSDQTERMILSQFSDTGAFQGFRFEIDDDGSFYFHDVSQGELARIDTSGMTVTGEIEATDTIRANNGVDVAKNGLSWLNIHSIDGASNVDLNFGKLGTNRWGWRYDADGNAGTNAFTKASFGFLMHENNSSGSLLGYRMAVEPNWGGIFLWGDQFRFADSSDTSVLEYHNDVLNVVGDVNVTGNFCVGGQSIPLSASDSGNLDVTSNIILPHDKSLRSTTSGGTNRTIARLDATDKIILASQNQDTLLRGLSVELAHGTGVDTKLKTTATGVDITGDLTVNGNPISGAAIRPVAYGRINMTSGAATITHSEGVTGVTDNGTGSVTLTLSESRTDRLNMVGYGSAVASGTPYIVNVYPHTSDLNKVEVRVTDHSGTLTDAIAYIQINYTGGD